MTAVIPVGHVPVYVGQPGISAISAGAAGKVQITVDKDLLGITKIQIWAAVVTGAAVQLVGTWDLDYIDPTTADLVGSLWIAGAVLASASMSCIIVSVVS